MRIGSFFAVATLAAASSLATASAASRPASCTSALTSVYGTIKYATGNTFALNATDDLNGRYVRTTRDDGTLLVHFSPARVKSDGLTVRPGVFSGVYGCFAGRDNFNASEVTLATSLQTYPNHHGRLTPDRDDQSMQSHGRQANITGTVIDNSARTSRLIIRMPNGRQIVLLTSKLPQARNGDRIAATGHNISKNTFVAYSARDLSR